jgi:hypothetical protein
MFFLQLIFKGTFFYFRSSVYLIYPLLLLNIYISAFLLFFLLLVLGERNRPTGSKVGKLAFYKLITSHGVLTFCSVASSTIYVVPILSYCFTHIKFNPGNPSPLPALPKDPVRPKPTADRTIVFFSSIIEKIFFRGISFS